MRGGEPDQSSGHHPTIKELNSLINFSDIDPGPGYNYPGTVFILLAFPGLGQGMAMGVNGNKGDRLQVVAASTLAELYGWPSGDYFNVQTGN